MRLVHNTQNRTLTGSIFYYILQEVVNEVQLTILSHYQYCVDVNPLGDDDGRPRLGCRELRKGPKTFYLHPGN